MRPISLKIALLAASVSIAAATPALADTTTTDAGAQGTLVTFASNDDSAGTDSISRPSGVV